MAQSARPRNDQPMTMKLLIVDDSQLIRDALLLMLESIQGIESVQTAATLAQALESVPSLLPTFVILDLHLPDGNAIQIIPSIKQLAPGVQLAMLTNDVSAFNRSQCMQAGADWFFDKTFEFHNLRDLVRQHAALH